MTHRVLAAALEHDLFVYPSMGMAGPAGGDGVMITPPFVIGREEVDFIISNLRLALDEVHPNLG